MSRPDQLAALTRINLDDTHEALGLPAWPWLRRGADWALRPAARRFAEQVLHLDALAAEQGLPAGAEWILRRFSRSLTITGQAHIPAGGPALILANHPGMADTVALFVALRRPDLRIVALDRPFLRALPHITRQLIFVADDPATRLTVVRQVMAELRAGHAVLTFPAGTIEPDPRVLPGAVAALAHWSDSATAFVRRQPALPIIPAVVRGVLSPAAHRNPLTRLRRKPADREKLAAMLQILIPAYRGVAVQVAFGPPLTLAACGQPKALHQAVLVEVKQLMEGDGEIGR
jgi:1-acyl-sn-glycerol-3-phosphate acyltransferase